MKRFLNHKSIFLILLVICFFGWAKSSRAEDLSIPDDRRVNWQGNVGVKIGGTSGIPDRNNICSPNANGNTVEASGDTTGATDPGTIQNALNSCPGDSVIKLGPGQYFLNASLSMPSHKTLRGAGMGETNLIWVSWVGHPIDFSVAWTPDGPARDWSTWPGKEYYSSCWGSTGSLPDCPTMPISSISKGSTQITTAADHGLNVGDYIIIDEEDDNSDLADPVVTQLGCGEGGCNWECNGWCGPYHRSLGLVAKVVSVASPNTFEVEMPIQWAFNMSRNPRVVVASNPSDHQGTWTQEAGVEKLTVDARNITPYPDSINFFHAANCWLSEVEHMGTGQSMVGVMQSYRIEIRGGKFHEASPQLPYDGDSYDSNHYALEVSQAATGVLIEDNQVYNIRAAIVIGGGIGNVYAYNYLFYPRQVAWRNAHEVHMLVSHGAHAAMNLIEGNVVEASASFDNYWGSGSHQTVFRNKISKSRVEGQTGSRSNYRIIVDLRSMYFNIVGNVLGAPGESLDYTMLYRPDNCHNDQNYYASANLSIGCYPFLYSGTDRTYETALIHGNYVYSPSEQTLWDPNISNHNIPPSLYLSSKPSWWGSLAWPAIGPDLSPKAALIPAQARFESSDTDSPVAPSGLLVD